MEVWDWWPFIIRRRKTIFWVTVLAVAVTAAGTFVMPATFRSIVILHVQPVSQNEVLSYPSASQMIARNAGEIIRTPRVTKDAAERLGKAELEGTLDYRVPEDTGLVEVIVDAPSPQLAADEANAVAESFLAYNSEIAQANITSSQKSLEDQLDRMRAQIDLKQEELDVARSQPGSASAVTGLQDELETLKTGYEGVLARWQVLPSAETLLSTSIHIADRAVPEPEPVSPRPLLNLILAVAGGLLFGIAIARMTDHSPVQSRAGV